MMTTLTARPEAITFDPQQSALIVVDMQNAYATPGGYLDLAGFDVSTTRPVIANIQTAVTAARAAGMLIIWFQNGWDEQYVEAGGPGSPNFHKSNALKTMRKQPQLQEIAGEGSWDYQLVDELVPQPGDIVLPKPRYSGFFNTPLDSILRSRGIRHLVFTGIATNVCVESTLRDGFFWSISAWCWKTQHTRRGRNLHRKLRCSISKPFWLGQRRRNVLRRAFFHVLCSYRLRSLTMPKSVIIPAGSSAPLAPFVPGTLADGVVYVSGTLAFDQHNNVLFADDPKAQTRHVLETIRKVIETAGGTMADVTFNSIFITDWKNYAAINEIYAEFFPGDKPARFCIQCGLVKPDALVEIATIAHIAK